MISEPALSNNLTIEIKGNVFFSSQYLMGNTRLKNKSDIENLVTQIIRYYTDAGYPFCRVYPEIIPRNNGIEKIVLRIEEGSRITISDYLFDIPGKTEEGVVRKIMGLKPGRFFSSKEINHSKEQLFRTRAFEDIDDNIIFRDGNYYMLFHIKEKKSDYLTTSGSFGENDAHFTVNFFSLNLLGTLRQLQFDYEYRRLFSLQFTEPVLIFPAALNIRFSLWTYDSVRLAQLHGKFTAPLGNYFGVSLMSGIQAVSYPADNSDTQGYTNNLIGIGFSLTYDTLDLSFKQNVDFEHLFRHYDRWKIQYVGEFDFKKLTVRTHYYVVDTDSFEYFDYVRIGGVEDLRGYYEEEFIASHAIWFNTEYRKFLVFPLFDIGVLDHDIKFSYGLGIEAKSKIADASLIVAWPRQGSWQDGKIHLMFEKGF